jgi:tetratricopeptide (TPR) repeat protein
MAWLWLAVVSCAPGTVTRVVDGETREGRSIPASAYAAYARAELLAAEGDRKHALEHYARAIDQDPGSPELIARYGEILCEEAPGPDALDRFEHALELDPEYAPAFLGRARCLSRLGRTAEALAAAERAAMLDPMSFDTTREVARLLFALRRSDDAWRWLDARLLLEPGSRGAHALLLEAAEREHDAGRAERARRALAVVPAVPPAREQPLASASVAPHRALELAERRLAADPEDTDAWTVGLVAADLVGNEWRFRKILSELGETPLPITPAAFELLTELVTRRCGREAAAALVSGLPVNVPVPVPDRKDATSPPSGTGTGTDFRDTH